MSGFGALLFFRFGAAYLIGYIHENHRSTTDNDSKLSQLGVGTTKFHCEKNSAHPIRNENDTCSPVMGEHRPTAVAQKTAAGGSLPSFRGYTLTYLSF